MPVPGATPPRAATLGEIDRFARPAPLTPSTWDYYINTDLARDNTGVSKMIKKLRNAHTDGRRVHFIFAGHSGCGKSTEMVRVRLQVEDLYDIQACDVTSRLSLAQVDYRQIIFLLANELVEHARSVGAELERETVEGLLNWFDEVTIKEVNERSYQLEAEAGGRVMVKTDAGIPLVLKMVGELFARFSGKIKSGGGTKETATRHIEQRLDSLMKFMTLVADAIEAKIKPRRLLLVVENLDKIDDAALAKEIFFHHHELLVGLPFSVVFTFPIVLWYESENGVARYQDHHLLPMISIRTAPPSHDFTIEQREQHAKIGRQTLRDLVHRRIEPALIAADALDLAIDKSGGVIRDLLFMLREAALDAEDQGEQIELAHVQRAARTLRNDYRSKLGPRADSTAVTAVDIDDALGDPADWPRRAIAQTPAFRQLLQGLCILEYNGDVWYDLHPAVRDYLGIKLDEERRRPTAATPKAT